MRPLHRLAALGWDHGRRVLAGLTVLLVLCGVALPGLVVDPSIGGLLGHDAEENRATERVRALFGTDESAVVVVSAEDVLDPTVLTRIRSLTEALEDEVPHAAEALSLTAVPITRREGDQVRLEPALSPWPEDDAAMAARVALLEQAPVVQSLLVSPDRTLTFVMLMLQPPPEGQRVSPPEVLAEVMDGVRAVVARHEAPGWSLGLTGKAAIPDALGRTLPRDVIRYALLAMVISVVVLGGRFRHLSGVVLPLVVTLLPLLGTLAAMALLGDPLQLPSAVLPPLMLVISVAGVVHVLSELEARLRSAPFGRETVLATLQAKAEPVALAALTTAVGMISLTLSELEPAVVVGRYGTLAVALGLVSTVVVIPAWIRVFGWPTGPRASASGGAVWALFARVATHSPRGVVALALAVLVAGLASARSATFAHDPLSWLAPDWEVRENAERLDRALHLSVDVEVRVDTGAREGVRAPAVIRRVTSLAEALDRVHHGPVRSVVAHLDALRQAFDGDTPYEDGPLGRRRLSRDLGLLRLAAPDAMVTPDGRHLRLTVHTDAEDASAYPPLIATVERLADTHLEGLSYEVAGQAPMFAATLSTLRSGAALAWLVALLGGGLLMLVVARSVPLGLALLVPNTLPAAVALGSLTWMGVPLDLFVLLTISLAVGTVVDDAIHLVTTLRQAHARHGDPERAVAEALRSAGPSIVLTTVLLSAGWLTLMVSPIPAVRQFGVLSSATLAVGLLADLVVTPAVFVVWGRAGAVRRGEA